MDVNNLAECVTLMNIALMVSQSQPCQPWDIWSCRRCEEVVATGVQYVEVRTEWSTVQRLRSPRVSKLCPDVELLS